MNGKSCDRQEKYILKKQIDVLIDRKDFGTLVTLRQIMADETRDHAEGRAELEEAPAGTIVLETPHIVSTPGVLGGKPRIAGHRISVQDVAIWHERMGMSVDEIATNYELRLAQVYAALAYYFDHREEVDARIRQGATLIQELKQQFPSRLAEHRRG